MASAAEQPAPDAATPADPHPREADVRRFVEAWGRMGSVWGISRTMAEVHALLYITGEPLCADDIMDRLAISRGNASMSLRGLLDWGVITRAHRRGDRKDYFVAEQDVWAIFKAIVRERKKREVDPLIASLHEIRDHTREARHEKAKRSTDDVDKRLDAMLDFLEMASALGDRFMGPTGPGLRLAATVLSKAPLPDDRNGRRSGARP